MSRDRSTRRRAASLLARSHTLDGVRSDARRLRRRWDRRASPQPASEEGAGPAAGAAGLVDSYLAEHDVRGLQIGCGRNLFDGWLSTDVHPKVPGVLAMDATQEFPLPDESFDAVYAEHMIEHVSWRKGQRMLAECRRILRPGGTVRLATPDLAVLLDLYAGDAGPDGDQYVRWITRRYLPQGSPRHPVFVLNNAMRNWGHTFLYDEEVLRLALTGAGFVDVRRCTFGESDVPGLRGLESHGAAVSNEQMVRFETMVLEATNPHPASTP